MGHGVRVRQTRIEEGNSGREQRPATGFLRPRLWEQRILSDTEHSEPMGICAQYFKRSSVTSWSHMFFFASWTHQSLKRPMLNKVTWVL